MRRNAKKRKIEEIKNNPKRIKKEEKTHNQFSGL